MKRDETYSSSERDLALDWAEKWLELIRLINEMTASSVPPTDTEELLYQSLRFWFMNRQAQFRPLWRGYFKHRISCQSCTGDDVAEFNGPIGYVENPFSCFYEPENLYYLAHDLELQSGTTLWEPSEREASFVRPLLVGLGEMVVDLADWVSDRSTSSLDKRRD